MSMKQVLRATIQSLIIDKLANPLRLSSLDPCEILIFLFFEMMFYSNRLSCFWRQIQIDVGASGQNVTNDELILSESILT